MSGQLFPPSSQGMVSEKEKQEPAEQTHHDLEKGAWALPVAGVNPNFHRLEDYEVILSSDFGQGVCFWDSFWLMSGWIIMLGAESGYFFSTLPGDVMTDYPL